MIHILEARWRMTKAKERMIRRVVWRLPRSVVMWAAVRVIANATTGRYANQVIPELSAMDALERWGT